MMLRLLQRLAARPARAREGALDAADEVRVAAREDGAVFLHAGTGAVFATNGTGAAMWERLRRGDTPEAIGSALSREFGAAADVVARDAARFAAALEAEGILVRSRAA